MPMRTSASRNLPARALTVAALIFLCGALSACDNRSSERVAIEHAAMKLQSLSAGGGRQSVLPAARLKTLESARQTLTPYKDTKDPATIGPVNRMLAEVASQMSEIELGKAAALESEAAAQAVSASRFIQLYTQQAATSDASGKVDLSGEITKLADQKRAREAELASVRQDRAKIKADADKLTSDAARAMEEAKAFRKQATEMQARLADVNATQGLTIVEEAAQVSRKADAAERKSAEITVNASARESEVADLDRTIGSLERTIKLVDDSTTSLRARSEQTQARSTETRADAQRFAADITSAIDTLTRFRDGELNTALSNAEKFASEALAASRKAGGTDRIGTAGYQLNLASVMMTRAQGQLGLARLLTSAANASPALPDQANLAARASKATADAMSAVEAARESYKEVREAFEGAGGSLPDSTKKTFEQIALALTALSDDRAAAPKNVEPGASAAPSGDADSAIAEVKVRIDELRAAAQAMDMEKVISFVKASDSQRDALRKVGNAAKNFKVLDDAVQAKLGKSFAEAMGPQGAIISSLNSINSAVAEASSDSFTYAAQGPDRVIATPKEPKPGLDAQTWLRDNGQWLTEFPPEMSGPQTAMMLPMIEGIGSVYSELAADVNSGKITTDQQLQQAFQLKMAPIMQKMMGGMGMPDPNK